ncbi:hypothetical protein [Streptomyces sp. NPDC002172]
MGSAPAAVQKGRELFLFPHVIEDEQSAGTLVEETPQVGAGQVGIAEPGSVVPAWRDGLEDSALAPDYRRLVDVLAGGSEPGGEAMDCRQLAMALGLEAVPAKVEGVRSKAKRLVARGWLAEERPGMFSAVARRVSAP